MSHTLRRGLAAGFLAGLVLAMIDFVTDGAPGNNFPSVLHWFGINPANSTISHFGGFFLLLVLAGIFGLIFGALQRATPISAGRALLLGLALGLLWWLIFGLLLNNIMNHASSPFSLSLGGFLASFPIDLLFGMLLGAIYLQLQGRQQRRRRSTAVI
jgi:hypothetical protein